MHAPSPKNVAELRSFLGLLNYYGRFIPNLSSLLHPLNSLLRHNTTWRWTKPCREAFKVAEEKIVSPNILVHYDSTRPIRLAADASAYGIGSVISHVMETVLSGQLPLPHAHCNRVNGTMLKWRRKRYRWCLGYASFTRISMVVNSL